MTLKFVEDYIEFLYGTMDREGNGTQNTYGTISISHIKLATYDKSPVSSMGSFCAKARISKYESCLTDRQVGLARKIIFKYRRQLQILGIVLPKNENDLELRHPVRSIDRTKYLQHDVENKVLSLKFPYDPKKISALHDYVTHSAGNVEWINNDKKWVLDLTERNVAKILELFKDEDLKVDESLEPIITDIMTADKSQLPTLSVAGDKFELKNCSPRIEEYLSTKSYPNLDVSHAAYWVSQAVSLGVEIDSTVDELLPDNEQVKSIIKNRSVVLPSKNQPNGEWYDNLLITNQVLSDVPWVLYLNWWTKETDWSRFKNTTMFNNQNKNSFNVTKPFVDLLQSLEDPIVIVDSIIGRDVITGFIEHHALKVIYISDIGNPLK